MFACFTLIYAICMEISAFTSPSVACLLNMIQQPRSSYYTFQLASQTECTLNKNNKGTFFRISVESVAAVRRFIMTS